MKKVLLATTALVATAGFAMADVSLSGSAEMGIAVGPDKSADVDYEGGVIATADAKAADHRRRRRRQGRHHRLHRRR